MALLPLSQALQRILDAIDAPRGCETVPLGSAFGRTLAADVVARRSQPPFASSAMDGYAVRARDVASGQPLRVIGTAAAGHAFTGAIHDGEAVRIFTGAPVPPGADRVVIQEQVERLDAEHIRVPPGADAPRHMRGAGLDFREGARLLTAGTVLDARHLALAASGDHAELPVRPRPRVTILSTGDELTLPGAARRRDQIVSSNSLFLAAQIPAWGGAADDAGLVPDTLDATRAALGRALEAGARLIVTSGGASVGDHDHVPAALSAEGFELGFWKIAMRPGKPLMFGRRDDALVLGLPGNPVACAVCALVFLRAALRAQLGQPDPGRLALEPAILGRALGANDLRAEFLRAALERDNEAALPVATPFDEQDSSMFRLFAKAGALVFREAHAPAMRAGDMCRILRL